MKTANEHRVDKEAQPQTVWLTHNVAHERARRNPSLLVYEVYHVHRVSFLEKRGLRLLVPPGESCCVLFEFVLLELTPGS